MVYEATAVLDYEAGLHLRPAMLIANALQGHDAEVVVVCNGKEADARSILMLMELCAVDQSVLTIRAQGVDAEAACRAIVALVESKFSEGSNGD